MLHISLVRNRLRVGMKIKTNGSGHKRASERGLPIHKHLVGIIGEISKHKYHSGNPMCAYIFHNDQLFRGSVGDIKPQSKGYKYSWVIQFDNGNFEIEIVDDDYINWNETYGGIVGHPNDTVHETTWEEAPTPGEVFDVEPF